MIAHDGREKEDNGHDPHGTDEGSYEDGCKTCKRKCPGTDATAKEQDDKCNAKPGTTTDAKDRRVGKRVAECRLEHESTDSERCTRQQRRDCLWKT